MYIFICLIVLAPNVNVVYIGNQEVGSPLSLICNATAVRGINDSVDIIWMSDGRKNLSSRFHKAKHIINNQLVSYTSYYNITQLEMTDNNATYHCQAVINTSPTVNNTANITLNVVGGSNIIMCVQIIFCA